MSRCFARAIARELPLVEGGAPEWIALLPAGELHARDGRRWSHEDPAAVLAATRERAGGIDLVIDYEHQTDYARENGQSAPAAGWMRELEVCDGEIWARVEWTERAAAAIAGREYRYISPVFAFHPRTLDVQAVHRAALTNSPAFDLPALAHTEEDGAAMTPEQLAALAAALGLAKTATAEECLAKAKALSHGPVAAALGLAETATADDLVARATSLAASTSLGDIAAALGLAKTATGEEVLARAKARTAPNPGQFVPREEFDRVSVALTTIQTERTEERATAAVDAATAAGKIAPAQREWALGYARDAADGFDAYAAAAPVIVDPVRIGEPGPGRDPDAALTADELAACRAMGISAEAYKKSRTEIAQGRVQ